MTGARGLHVGASTRAQNFKKLSESESETVRNRIASIVGEKNVSLANTVRSQHGQDEGPDPGLIPDIVAFPGETGEVSEVTDHS